MTGVTPALAASTPDNTPASIAAVVTPVEGAVQTPEEIAAAAAAAAAPADDRPADLPEELWDATAKAPKYTDIKTRLEEAKTLREAAEASKANRYATVADVEFAVDVKLPDGSAIEFDKEDPFLKAAAAAMVEGNVEKPVVKALLTAFANSQLEQSLAANEELKAEFKLLGEPEAAKARVKGVEAFVASAFAANPKLAATAAAKATAFVRTLSSASQIEAIEALMAHSKEPNPGTGGGSDDNSSLRETNPGALIFKKAA